MKKYSIWIVPKGRLYEELLFEIKNISKKYGTEEFEPHLTLYGAFEAVCDEQVIKQTKNVFLKFKPFEVEVLDFGFTDQFYRCLFLRIEKTEELVELNRRVKQVFGGENPGEFMPHISLMYGENIPQAIKDQIIKNIADKYKKRKFLVNKIIINGDAGGFPKEWKLVFETNLQIL